MKHIEITVDEDKCGKRLDQFLADELSELTSSQIKKLISSSCILLNGESVKSSHHVHAGEHIEVNIPDVKSCEITPENIPLNIVYEDEDIVVINKAANMVVHPAQGNYTGTLVNALMHHCKDLSGVGGEHKPGIVHRLDKGTSGLMIAAKNDVAHLGLSKQFEKRTIKKYYYALIYGTLQNKQGEYNTSLGRSKNERKRMSSYTNQPREALTKWRIIERFGPYLTLVEIRLLTGRTHQIRVHFSEDNHALVGDDTYGSSKQPRRVPEGKVRKAVSSFTRVALHSHRLIFEHPRSGELLEFTADLPEDIETLLTTCRELQDESTD